MLMNAKSNTSNDIAIVGLGALFPGRGTTIGYWRDIVEGRDTTGDIPASHWSAEDYYDPDPKVPDKTYSQRGAFIPAFPFDPLTFGTPPNVVETTDTVQLMALYVAKQLLGEVRARAFRQADPERTSVVLGVAAGTELIADMASRLNRPKWLRAMRAEGMSEAESLAVADRISASFTEWRESTFPGLLGNVVAGRIANRLDLGGTNFAADAACGSSLAAARFAVQELQLGESDLVITGGADALNNIFMYMCFSKTPAMSPSGACRPFSDDADGTLMGEGCGLLALRRLADAERDGDHIYAVIKGIGTSSDGLGNSVYAPRSGGQARALRRAYEAAGYGPSSVELIEAHGTGTKAGDAAEFGGIREVFTDKEGGAKQWCALGSVKSQIGHTKSAAGAAGMIKAALALQHKVLPPTINVRAPHPKLAISDSPVYLNTEARPWIRSGDHPRRASVSSFGFGGSNFHVTLEEYRGPGITAQRLRFAPSELFLLAADSALALQASLQQLTERIRDDGDLPGEAYGAQQSFAAAAAHRLAIVAGTKSDIQRLAERAKAAIAAGMPLDTGDVVYATGPLPDRGKVAFLFSGQGSQYLSMGAGLAMNFEAARQVWDRLADMDALEGSRLDRLVFPIPAFDQEGSDRQRRQLTRSEVAQPAIGAVALSHLAILDALGIAGEVMAGHSFGEIMALHAAGAYSAEDAIKIARVRGEAMASSASEPGAMLAVLCDRERVETVLRDAGCQLTLANDNGPDQVVVSGRLAEVERAEGLFQTAGVRCRRLEVATAFHSPLVAEASQRLAQYLPEISFGHPSKRVYAGASAKPYAADPDAIRKGLAGQVSEPVRFRETLEALYGEGVRTFIEVGPSSVLSGLVAANLGDRPHRAISLDAKKLDGVSALNRALGLLALDGHSLNLAALWEEAPAPERRPDPKPHEIMLNGANYQPPPAPDPNHPSKQTPPKREAPQVKVPQPPLQPAVDSLPLNRGRAEAGPGLPLEPALLGKVGMLEGAAREKMESEMSIDAQSLQELSAFHERLANEQRYYLDQVTASHRAFVTATEDVMKRIGGEQPGRLAAPAALPQPPIPQVRASAFPGLRTMPPLEAPNRIEGIGSSQARRAASCAADPGSLASVTPCRASSPTGLNETQKDAAPTPLSQVAPLSLVSGPANDGAAQDEGARDQAESGAAQTLFSVVAEKTGYPSEMLGPAMDLEAELGIDSIKQVEILSALQQRLPEMPEIDPSRLAELRTLGQIAEAIAIVPARRHETAAAGVPVEVPAPSSQADAEADTAVSDVLRAVVGEKTGYPVEMLEPGMDLEAELGIDSIKQVEILSALQQRLPEMPEIDPSRLAELRTLGQIAEAITIAPVPGNEEVAAGAPVEAPALGSPSEAEADAAVSEVLRAVVAEKTGYPAEMLEPGMDLEAELGIDSIKQVEILSALQQRLPEMPEIDPSRLAELRTLGQIAEALSIATPKQAEEEPSAHPAVEAPATAAETSNAPDEAVSAVLRAVVAEKTGYPAEMLEPGMDLEAELGIDSIKQVEILSALQQRLPEMPEIDPSRLAELRTLGQIAEAIAPSATPLTAPSASTASDVVPSLSEGLVKEADWLGLHHQFVALEEKAASKSAPLPPSNRPIEVTGEDGSLASALVSAFEASGRTAKVVQAPSAGADVVITTAPLQPGLDGTQRSLNLLMTAKAIAETMTSGGGQFYVLQDSGGAFGRTLTSLDDAAAGGASGLAKTARQEWPKSRVKAIDLERRGQSDRVLAARVVEEVLSGDDDPEVALMAAGRRLVPLVKPAVASSEAGLMLPPGSLVVVPGGARGVTAAVVKRLAAALPLRFLLLGRSTLEPWPSGIARDLELKELRSALARRMSGEGRSVSLSDISKAADRLSASREIEETLAAITLTDSEAEYCALDITDREATRSAVAQARAKWGPVGGIVFGAGVLADKLIRDKTEAQFDRVFRTKVDGLRSIVSAVGEDPLRFIALFSSIAARYGNAGQADYAMANEVLNRAAWVLHNNRPNTGCCPSTGGHGPAAWPTRRCARSSRHAASRSFPRMSVRRPSSLNSSTARPGRSRRHSSADWAASKVSKAAQRRRRGPLSCRRRRSSPGPFDPSMPFEPVAIVGQGAVLPGALSADALWQAVAEGRDLLTEVPAGRWPVAPGPLLDRLTGARKLPFRGGFVTGFDEVFQPDAFLLAKDALLGEDPGVLWLLEASRQALEDAGRESLSSDRAAVVVGNLSYPTKGMMELAHRIQIEPALRAVQHAQAPRWSNRFGSGRPAHLLAAAIGARGPAFCLDAACASSLYALHYACRYLQAGTVDVAVAAGLNACDNIFLHLGFAQIKALSPTGRSRPFNRQADGLIPSEGAAALVLKRLETAVSDGDRIHAVIRAIGLSNDGRDKGLLSPSSAGQLRAMEAAYLEDGLDPASVSLVECHATGTAIGDNAELTSLRRLLPHSQGLPVGSLKSNTGHLITVAGIAATIKVMGAMRTGVMPASLNAEAEFDGFRDGRFRPLLSQEAWPNQDLRRAAISNFGFGGNNAHMVIEEYRPRPVGVARGPELHKPPQRLEDDVVVCGIGAIVGQQRGLDEIARALFAEACDPARLRVESAQLPLTQLRFPPVDLANSLGQQVLTLEAALSAVEGVTLPAPERSGCIVGMGCDVEAGRIGLVWRAIEEIENGRSESGLDARSVESAIPHGEGAGWVTGAMPNLVTNRVNVQLDLQGLGFSLSSEELSGLTAIEIAEQELLSGRLDLVLAGAVDISQEEVHRRACEEVIGDPSPAADAAILFALKRRADAERDGDQILAIIKSKASTREAGAASAAGTLGRAHCVTGCQQLVEKLILQSSGQAMTDGSSPAASPAAVRSFTGQYQEVALEAARLQPGFGSRREAPHLVLAAAGSREELAKLLLAGGEGEPAGACRVAIAAKSRSDLEKRRQRAAAALVKGDVPSGLGIAFGEGPPPGEVAFLYPALGSVYPGAGLELLQAFPDGLDDFIARNGAATTQRCLALLQDEAALTNAVPHSHATSFHAAFTTRIFRSLLGVDAPACIGLSVGQLAMLVAHDVWDWDGTAHSALEEAGFFTGLTGDYLEIAQQWALPEGSRADWHTYRVNGPLDQVKAAVAKHTRCWVTMVTSPLHCFVAGDPEACRAALDGLDGCNAIKLQPSLAFHGPFARRFEALWRKSHTLPTRPREDVRFYFTATEGPASLDPESLADAYTKQGFAQVDLRPALLRAWQDGVRVFVDLGPRAMMAAAVAATLGDRPHQALPLDRRSKQGTGLMSLATLCCRLYAAGVPIEIAELAGRFQRLRGERAQEKEEAIALSLPVHQDPISLKAKRPAVPSDPQFDTLPPAPPVGSVNHDSWGQGIAIALREALPMTMEPPPGQASPARLPSPRDEGSPSSEIKAKANALAKVATMPLAKNPPFEALPVLEPSGPSFDRGELEQLASGSISGIFGPIFAPQDGYRRQCRMPEPPLLLADRVLGIEGEAGSMGTGICWTETDVRENSWYLHHGRMPVGVAIEAGQADLLLISWLGVDLLNRDQRVYRLLGCEITFHDGPLPSAGDTLRYQIHIDGHAKLGDTRLFFFRYDSRISDRLFSSVRHGQAGFFSDAELAGSDGVIWSAERDEPAAGARMDTPPCITQKTAFSEQEVGAFWAGDPYGCFGAGFERAAAHQRSPGMAGGRMRLIDRVVAFDPEGGPWGRGYLRAEADVPQDAWLYQGHFKNDPCMPGTLMADAAVQALAFYMAALGFTIKRDGWRFQPVTGEPFTFICRGQVIPDRDHLVTYEVFIEEVVEGDSPKVYAALLASCDGFKIFLCRRFGLKLEKDWPLYDMPFYKAITEERRFVSPQGDVPGDYKALLAAAWGRPSDAFGSLYRRFDGPETAARLPGPPYHFMSRICSIDCPAGEPRPGAKLVCEYDVPGDAWYFEDGGTGTMPFSVLTEVVLQPCGWLATYLGFSLKPNQCFRNLDGQEVWIEREVTPDNGTARLEVTFVKSEAAGAMSLVFFEVACEVADGTVVTLKTDFGYFPPDALAKQRGLPVTAAQREGLAAESAALALDPFDPAALPALPKGRLAMVDEVTGFWPGGGRKGLGRAVGRQMIDPGSWYFRAHFFEDPVQPGSLGLEALFNLFKATVKLAGLDRGFEQPRFQSPAPGRSLGWKYRGQVVPLNKEVITEIELIDVSDEEDGRLIVAEGSLWVDGLRIYEVSSYCLRIVESRAAAALEDASKPAEGEGWVLDTERQPWLLDHCPTHNVPVLPVMGLVAKLIADRAPLSALSLEVAEVTSWVLLDRGPVRLVARPQQEAKGSGSLVIERRDQGEARAVGRAAVPSAAKGMNRPAPWADCEGGTAVSDPYASGELSHGPAFRLVRNLLRSDESSSFELDIADALGRANGDLTILLDAFLHGIPHGEPDLWFGEAARDKTAIPYRIEDLLFFAPLPREGVLRVRSRAVGAPSGKSCEVALQVCLGEEVLASMTVKEALCPTEAYAGLPLKVRRGFMRGGEESAYYPWSLARLEAGSASLSLAKLRSANILPGIVEGIYGVPTTCSLDERRLAEVVAIKDYFARRSRLHPARVDIDDDGVRAEGRLLAPSDALSHRWKAPDQFTLSVDEEVLPPACLCDGSWSAAERASPNPVALAAGLYQGPELMQILQGEGWDQEGVKQDLWRLLLRSFLEGALVTEAVAPGPTVFLADERYPLDLPLIAAALSGLRRAPVICLLSQEFELADCGALLQRLMGTSSKLGDLVQVRFVELCEQQQLSDMLDASRVSVEGGRVGPSLLVSAEEAPSLLPPIIDAAVGQKRPIHPVGLVRGCPEEGRPRRSWPERLEPRTVVIGSALEHHSLKALAPEEIKTLVRKGLEGSSLGRPEGERDRNIAMDRRVRRLQAETGLSQTKAILADLLLSTGDEDLSLEGRKLRRWMTQAGRPTPGPDDRELYRFALWICDGPGGLELPWPRDDPNGKSQTKDDAFIGVGEEVPAPSTPGFEEVGSR